MTPVNPKLAHVGRDVTSARSELGFRAIRSFAMESAMLTLRSRVAWAHNFNPDRYVSATFQALPGASYVVNGASIGRDAALLSASAEMAWRTNWSVALSFEGEFANVSQAYAGKGTLRYAW